MNDEKCALYEYLEPHEGDRAEIRSAIRQTIYDIFSHKRLVGNALNRLLEFDDPETLAARSEFYRVACAATDFDVFVDAINKAAISARCNLFVKIVPEGDDEAGWRAIASTAQRSWYSDMSRPLGESFKATIGDARSARAAHSNRR
jgi:hypothetical protein